MTHTATALNQAVTIEQRMNGAFGRDGNTGKSANQAFAIFRAPQLGCSRFTFKT